MGRVTDTTGLTDQIREIADELERLAEYNQASADQFKHPERSDDPDMAFELEIDHRARASAYRFAAEKIRQGLLDRSDR